MNRRGFLQGILAAGAAPAIVRIGSLMPVRSIMIPTTAEVLAFHPDYFSLETRPILDVELIAQRIATTAKFMRAQGVYDDDYLIFGTRHA